MKAYLLALVYAALLAFIFGSGWYAFFGYDPYISMPENVVAVYTNPSFWRGLVIWTLLYALFVTIPFTYIKKRTLTA